MNVKMKFVCAMSCLVVGPFALVASAATLATDNAGNYSSFPTGSSNLGTGFGNWTNIQSPANPSFGGFFLPTGSTSQTAQSGKLWGIYANTNNIAELTRPMTGTLSASQQVQVTMANGSVTGTGVVGVSLRAGGNTSADNRVEFYATNSANYKLNINGIESDTGIAKTSQSTGIIFEFTAVSATSYIAKIFNATGTQLYSTAGAGTGFTSIDRIRLFNFNAGSGGGADQFFGRLSVIPEPSVVIGSLAAASVLLRRRRALV
jgi:hypothetical protein